jgi:hypothetical protein
MIINYIVLFFQEYHNIFLHLLAHTRTKHARHTLHYYYICPCGVCECCCLCQVRGHIYSQDYVDIPKTIARLWWSGASPRSRLFECPQGYGPLPVHRAAVNTYRAFPRPQTLDLRNETPVHLKTIELRPRPKFH